MYDSRLRLSKQVRRGTKHFNDMVFDTIIQRNVNLVKLQVLAKASLTMTQQVKEQQTFAFSARSNKEKQQIIYKKQSKQSPYEDYLPIKRP
jgi:hypothetical protein